MMNRNLKLTEAMLDTACDAIIAVDSGGRVIEWNRRATEIFGWKRENTIGKSIIGLIMPIYDRPIAEQLMIELKGDEIEGLLNTRHEIELVNNKGDIFPVEILVSEVDIEGEKVYTASLHDINNRHRIERQLREVKDRYRIAVQGAGVGIWDWERKAKVLYISGKFKQLLGYDSSLTVRTWRDFRDLIHPEDRKKVINKFRSHYRRQTALDVDCRMKTNMEGYCWFHISGQAIIDNRGRVLRIAGSLADVNSSYIAEKALRDSETKFREAFANAPIGICLILPNGKFLTVNRRLCEMLGYSSEELSRRAFAEITHPDDVELSTRVAEQLLNGEVENVTYEKRYICRNAKTIWTQVIASVHCDEEGQPLYYISQIIDITEKREAQLQKEQLESQLRQAQKLETIGTLAGGIAHDFNNILTPILGFAEIASMNLPKDSSVQSNITHVIKAANRAKDLVKQILAFGRRTEQCYRPQSLIKIIGETVNLMRATLPSTIGIKVSSSISNDKIMCDSVQIHQVIMNLCTNAYQAISANEGGTIEIGLRNCFVEENIARYHPHLKAGDHLLLTISDTGHGMKWEIAQRIFEPFFTTKDPGSGTGLGLSVAHGIIAQHGGEITVYSQPGNGTTFHIYLPTCEKPEISSNGKTPLSALGGSGHILFIDDEEDIALTGKAMLERLGYRVTAVSSSPEALEMFRSYPDDFDIVITDQTMPRMTGDRIAKHMLDIRPDLPVILVTGLSESITVEMRNKLGVKGFLMKPFSFSELGSMVKSIREQARKHVEVYDEEDSHC
jgi:PAS domain S-box-containing protein